MSCEQCEVPGCEWLRKKWGCDEPNPRSTLFIRCLRCGGKAAATCTRCDRQGMERVERCPNKTITADAWAAIHAYHLMTEHGILPVAGGMADQAASFDRAFRLIDAEVARATQEPQETRESRRDRFEQQVLQGKKAATKGVTNGVR